MPRPSSAQTSDPLVRELIANRGRYLTFASRIVAARDEAEDVVQDALLQACRLNGVCPDCPAGYACRMIRNLCLDRLRRAETRRGIGREIRYTRAPDAAENGTAALEGRQALRAILSALAALPPRTRAIFLRHRLGGRAQADLARDFALSPARINALVQRADAACRLALAEDSGDRAETP